GRARRRSSGAEALLPAVSGDDVGPKRPDVVGLEHVLPGRHAPSAVGHRVDEAGAVFARKLAQVSGPRRVGEARPVAGLAVRFVELGALFDLLRGKRLRPDTGAGSRESEAEKAPHAPNQASKQTSTPSRRAEPLSPRPGSARCRRAPRAPSRIAALCACR